MPGPGGEQILAPERQTGPAPPRGKRDNGNGENNGNRNDNGGVDAGRQPKRARITRENLNPPHALTKEKGAGEPPPNTAGAATGSSSYTKAIPGLPPDFADQLGKNGILNPRRSKPPANLGDLAVRLARSRGSPSPPDSEYESYLKATGRAGSTEMTVLVEMAPLLKPYGGDDGYSREFNRPFTAMPKDVGFNNNLPAPQPDFIEGLEKPEYRPFPVDKIPGAVLYRHDPDSLALPHLAGEWKGPGQNLEEARLQSAYGGAALVHGRNQALSAIGTPDPPGHANITTFTTDGTTLNFFAHYAAPAANGTPEYHQYPIASTNLKSSAEEFKKGRRQLRNAQDNARQESYRLRDMMRTYRQAPSMQAPAAAKEHRQDDVGGFLEAFAQPMPFSFDEALADLPLSPIDDEFFAQQIQLAFDKSPSQSPD